MGPSVGGKVDVCSIIIMDSSTRQQSLSQVQVMLSLELARAVPEHHSEDAIDFYFFIIKMKPLLKIILTAYPSWGMCR